MNTDNPIRRKPRGRMPAKVIVTARFVVSETFTYPRTYAKAKAQVDKNSKRSTNG